VVVAWGRVILGVMASERPISKTMVVASTFSASEDVCHEIIPKLEERGFSKEDVFAVHLALQEAFINAVRHGNGMDSGKAVRVEYSVDGERFVVSVADEGAGFDPESVPDPRCGENLYKPNGRGLLLMRSYMDVVEYNERGNEVRMVRYKHGSTEGQEQQIEREAGRG